MKPIVNFWPVTSPSVPTLAVVKRSQATYFKPLYEALAAEMPTPWRLLIVWPDSLKTEHPDEHVTPVGDNIDIVRVGNRKHGQQFFMPSPEIFQELAQHNVRAVWIHEYSLFTLCALLHAKLHRIPCLVSSDVGMRNAAIFPWHVRLWHSLWSHLADGALACTPSAHEPMCGERRLSTSIYHAVDSRVFMPQAKSIRDDDIVIFVFSGRLIPAKGIRQLIEASAVLYAEIGARFKVRIIGGGEAGWIHELIAKHQLTEIIELSGFLTGAAMRQAFGRADVFVFPTLSDTYGVVIHEAACLGLPLLVSQYAGAAEALVMENETGFIFDPDDVQTLASLMKRMLDAKLRERLGANARQRGEQLSSHERGRALWHWLSANQLCA